MNRRKLIFSSGVANSFEWYDYALFGLFAPIIAQKFFPSEDPSTALLETFFVFAVGYCMRPLGGIFFGVIGDRFGRKVALSLSVICMAAPTAAIGLIPSYESIGITATTLMILVRMVQGLSMGGALTGSISFIIEHTPKEQRGLIGSVPMASICIGILLGSSISILVRSLMSTENFLDFGWRIPFLLGIFIFFAGVYIRKYTTETPLFEDAKNRGEIVRSPLKKVIKYYWFDMLVSMAINATGSVLFYLVAIYLVSYLKITRKFDDNAVTILANAGYVLMAFFTIFVAWLSDKIGRRKIYLINLIIIIVLSPILLELLEVGDFTTVAFAYIAMALMAAAYIGPEPALQAEFYPTNIRNTALSVSYNMATSIFGGTTPYFIALLVQNTSSITYSVYYIIAISVLSIIGLYFYKDRSSTERKVEIKSD